ncbi:MAG TPA: hypothetical protein VM266_12360, partial [Solirubrobacteraceae bacterium]|nr:hypothetical protein [Solirubrobacteraceae bacterium]
MAATAQRLAADLCRREAQHAVAERGQAGVARAVALEGAAGAVGGPAVRLDDHAPPQEVDPASVHAGVALRDRQRRLADQREQAVFELRARESGGGVLEQRVERRGPVAAAALRDERGEARPADEAQVLGLVEHAREVGERQDLGEVEDRPLRRR